MAFLLSSRELLIAAPPTLLRQGLLHTLREAWPNRPVSCTTDAARLPTLLRRQPYALVVVDGSLLSPATLATVLRQLAHEQPHLPLLLLSHRLFALASSTSTAWRLLPCHASPAAVATAVAELLALAPVVPAAATRPIPHSRSAALSRRELEVLTLIMADLSNEDIAERLFVSVRTVESHRRTMLQKSGVRTPVGLVVRALREGWVNA